MALDLWLCLMEQQKKIILTYTNHPKNLHDVKPVVLLPQVMVTKAASEKLCLYVCFFTVPFYSELLLSYQSTISGVCRRLDFVSPIEQW